MLGSSTCPSTRRADTWARSRSKLQEFGIRNADLRELKAGQKTQLGGFGLEFIGVNHSIPDAVAIAIRTGAGLIVFSGDYKIDLTPIEGSPMDLGRLAALGEEGVLAYFGDSTNSERPGYVPSERVVGEALEKVFERPRAGSSSPPSPRTSIASSR